MVPALLSMLVERSEPPVSFGAVASDVLGGVSAAYQPNFSAASAWRDALIPVPTTGRS